MKILTFSDSHLSDRFDEKKFEYLSSIIKEADQVILNGDFWDHYATNFNKFVNSQWKRLFPLLKEKRTVYIYGNHDSEKFSDNRVNLFSDIQTESYELKSGDKTFVFKHGNQFFPGLNEFIESRFVNALIDRILNPVQYLLLRKFDGKLFKLSVKKTNGIMKRRLRKELKPNQIYVCGHTHYPEVDLKHNFINTGINNYGLGQSVWIEDGKITFKEKWYS